MVQLQHNSAGIFTIPSPPSPLFPRIPHFLASLPQYPLAQMSLPAGAGRDGVAPPAPQDWDFHHPLTPSMLSLFLAAPLAPVSPQQDQGGLLVHPSPSPAPWQQQLAPHTPPEPLPTWQPLGEGCARFSASRHKAFPNNGHCTTQPCI